MDAQITNVRLLPSEKRDKMQRDIDYLLEIRTFNLLFPFYLEAGLSGTMNAGIKHLDFHDGWDNPLCQIRGTFTGHWLSAAARIYQETGHQELRGKADYIVSQIRRCQETNGNGWAFPIPEKYIYSLRRGVRFWAPQYVCHKVMMGLLDMYIYAGNDEALEVLLGCTDWFYAFVKDTGTESLNRMMDLEETGGIMELWGDLYQVTGDPRHKELMLSYERKGLTGELLAGRDVLTNMHANMTVPEIHGCARAYEITGDDRFRRIVEAYWKCAVTDRGCFATGGQTSGEVWTGKNRLSSRLGDMNQEHCVVYNMIRLADYLYRWTGDTEYQDYIEMNIENGLMAQGFWKADQDSIVDREREVREGLITYYLPLAPGSKKLWGSKFDHFWCCHCTLVQANARFREFVYYTDDRSVSVMQFIPSEAELSIGGAGVRIRQEMKDTTGDMLRINDISSSAADRPDSITIAIEIEAEKETDFALKIRKPWWTRREIIVMVNGKAAEHCVEDGCVVLDRTWKSDSVEVSIPYGITSVMLDSEGNEAAFLEGPVTLAGLIDHEYTLYGDVNRPESFLTKHNERKWTTWLTNYRTTGQDMNILFKPIKDIGDEVYTVYFPVKDKN